MVYTGMKIYFRGSLKRFKSIIYVRKETEDTKLK